MASQVTAGRFVGRTQELARLHQLLARAIDGQPLVALLGGEAGVGKSRLVEQLAAAAGGQGVRVLRGRCVPLGEGGCRSRRSSRRCAAWPTSWTRRAGGGRRPGPGRAGPAAAGSGPGWRGGRGTAGGGVAGASQAGQGRLFERLLGVVQRLTARVPLLLVMGGPALGRPFHPRPGRLPGGLAAVGAVLVVGTFRSDELDRLYPLRGLLGELARNRRVWRLELARFSRAEVAEQLAGLLGTGPPAGLVDDIYARSEGDPFFAEELLLAAPCSTSATPTPASPSRRRRFASPRRPAR